MKFDFTLHNMDCIEGMRRMVDDASVDLIITDPPFGIEFKASMGAYNRKKSNVLEGYNEVREDSYLEFTRKWMSEANRSLKKSGSMFVFSGWNNLKDILVAAEDLGLKTVNHIIWKFQFGVVCSKKFVSSHYHVLYFCKEDKLRQFNQNSRFSAEDKTDSGGSARYRDLEDVWNIKREYWSGKKKTPNKLPSEVIRKIFSYVGKENDVVMDPFLGSGQVGMVSQEYGCKFIGFEIVPEYAQFAWDRVASSSNPIV